METISEVKLGHGRTSAQEKKSASNHRFRLYI